MSSFDSDNEENHGSYNDNTHEDSMYSPLIENHLEMTYYDNNNEKSTHKLLTNNSKMHYCSSGYRNVKSIVIVIMTII